MDSNSTESRLILALQALKNDPNLSVKRAASIYSVARSTLISRRAGVKSRRDIQPKSLSLSFGVTFFFVGSSPFMTDAEENGKLEDRLAINK
jgi:hypothetical protein